MSHVYISKKTKLPVHVSAVETDIHLTLGKTANIHVTQDFKLLHKSVITFLNPAINHYEAVMRRKLFVK